MLDSGSRYLWSLLFCLMLMPLVHTAHASCPELLSADAAPLATLSADSITAVALHTVAPPDAGLLRAPVPPADTIVAPSPYRNRDWLYLIRNHAYKISDPDVEYPRFIGFCVKVYNWADRVFNGTDHDYVVGTGHRWKIRLTSDNWVDSYAMSFRHKNSSLRMMGDIYSNVGIYLHYMALSVGYSIDFSTLTQGKGANHTKFETNFSCARFSADLYYNSNTNGTYLRKLKGYNDNHLFKAPFPGVELHNFGVNFYYFLNNRRYSHGAAYNYSKIQLRSAGSAILGFCYSNQDISLDFSTLDPKFYYPLNLESYYMKFHYYNFALLFGYGYNWVPRRHWLLNIALMPSVGFNHCYEDSVEGSGELLSLNIHGRMSATYNVGDWFFGFIGKMNGNWYISRSLSFFNSIENFSFNAGFRF